MQNVIKYFAARDAIKDQSMKETFASIFLGGAIGRLSQTDFEFILDLASNTVASISPTTEGK